MSERNATPARSASPLGTWVDHHLYSFVASLGRVFRKPWAALLTIAVMALALALPLGLWLVLGNLERLAGNVERSREISVFLRQDVDAARAAALADELRSRGNIAGVEHQDDVDIWKDSGSGHWMLRVKGHPVTFSTT